MTSQESAHEPFDSGVLILLTPTLLAVGVSVIHHGLMGIVYYFGAVLFGLAVAVSMYVAILVPLFVAFSTLEVLYEGPHAIYKVRGDISKTYYDSYNNLIVEYLDRYKTVSLLLEVWACMISLWAAICSIRSILDKHDRNNHPRGGAC